MSLYTIKHNPAKYYQTMNHNRKERLRLHKEERALIE